jgi:hypothetical protein
VLFVETFSEPQRQRCPLVDGQRESLYGDGSAERMVPYSSRAAVI